MERNEIFTFEDVINIRNEYKAYKTLWKLSAIEVGGIISFDEWFHHHVEGWSNEEIVSGHLFND